MIYICFIYQYSADMTITISHFYQAIQNLDITRQSLSM